MVALITAAATIVTAVIYNIASIRAAKNQLKAEMEERYLQDRAADNAAQVAANAAMARVSEQMATTTYAFIDRLQTELAAVLTQRAGERLAYEEIIGTLRDQISLLDNEVRVLKQRL